MNINLQILVELTKLISEQNENPVRIEKNLVQKNPAKDKTRSYTVHLGSTYLTIHTPKNSQWSKAQQQKFSDQLYQMEQNKELFYQICEMKEPLVGSKSVISELRGGASGANSNNASFNS